MKLGRAGANRGMALNWGSGTSAQSSAKGDIQPTYSPIVPSGRMRGGQEGENVGEGEGVGG